MAAGGSPLDALPDELLGRVLFEAARRGWTERPACANVSLLDPDDDEPDVQPSELVKLKAVCRRFRRIVDDGSLWGRVALWRPDDAALDALTKLPEKARAAVRRFCLWSGNASCSPAGFRRFVSAFREHGQLEELVVHFSIEQGASVEASVLCAIKHFRSLLSLYIGVAGELEDVDWSLSTPHFTSPDFTEPFSMIQFLSKLEVLDLSIPLPVSVLEGLAPLSATLRALSFSAAVDGESSSPAAAISAAAKFTLLERLRLSFRSAADGRRFFLEANEADLRPLCALTQLRDLCPLCWMGWLGFLESMPLLEHVAVNCNLLILPGRSDVDAKYLSSLKWLRSLQFSYFSVHVDSTLRTMSVIAGLSTVEVADIMLFPEAFGTLGSMPLAWHNLLKLFITTRDRETGESNLPIPGAFLKRLASDVPSLRFLEVGCPLPLSTDLAAVSSLDFLSSLGVAKDAAEKLSRAQRENLRSVLLDTRVVFEDEGAGGAPQA